jgi:hypothetical protein
MATSLFAQEDEEKIDASKPTNFYTQLDNTLETTSRKGGATTYGYRAKFSFAPNSSDLILAEVPLLYNDNTEKIGLGDIRVRYFHLFLKDYTKFFGAFGPSIDLIIPTGNFKNGLGADRWIISPGIAGGLMFSSKFQVFPILSYQYTSKPVSDANTNFEKEPFHGVTLQFISSIRVTPSSFMFVTPVFRHSNFNDSKSFRYVQEIQYVYSVTKTSQITAFYRGNFKEEIHQFSIGYTMFL